MSEHGMAAGERSSKDTAPRSTERPPKGPIR